MGDDVIGIRRNDIIGFRARRRDDVIVRNGKEMEDGIRLA
jgi:hypothetical protein